MNNKEIRWKQRFENLKKAFLQLTKAVEKLESLSDLEKEGLVKRFEYTFELSWKTLKDYLESQEVDAKFPRAVIKQAFHHEIIDDGDIWMEMLENRNLMAHTYNEEIFNQVVKNIASMYFKAVKQVFLYLEKEI